MEHASLVQYFEAEGYTGTFGLMCGYAADEDCMEAIAERFTGLSATRRSVQGYASLLLMLDAGCPLPINAVSGVLRLFVPEKPSRPWRLLHAKVALLLFQKDNDSPSNTQTAPFMVRLLVSTGNWTRETATSSLDLMWHVDVEIQKFTSPSEAICQDCADVRAAWQFLSWLVHQHKTDVLSAVVPQTADSAHEMPTLLAEQWQFFRRQIETVAQSARGQQRFFDNRERSLLEQLGLRISQLSGSKKRNYLAMGSGYYEQIAEGGTIVVLPAIVDALKSHDLMTAGAEVEVYVNPDACQGVGQASSFFEEHRWHVCLPAYTQKQTFLHAKFLFGATYRGNSAFCLNPWVYLGSGNLTAAGFTQHGRQANLEAGVVFAPPQMRWTAGEQKDIPCVADVLPIAWQGNGNAKVIQMAELKPGVGFPDERILYYSPPVGYVQWIAHGHLLRLPHMDGHIFCYILQSDMKTPCAQQGDDFLWEGERPAQVLLEWREGDQTKQGIVLVIDEYGHMGAVLPAANSLEEALERLDDFPRIPDEDSDGEDDEGGDVPAAPVGELSVGDAHSATAAYPVRTIMLFIERIADKQIAVSQEDWGHWCRSLEQTLVDMAEKDTVRQICNTLKINPLSALYAEPFRPDFAQDNTSAAGVLYELTLQHIEAAWKLSYKEKFGDTL